MIAKGIERRWRHGVDGLGPDQLLYVNDVAILRILRARAGPKQALAKSAFSFQCLPPRALDQVFVTLIGQLGVGNGNFALERVPFGFGRQHGVNGGVDPADKETGHAPHAADVTAFRCTLLEPPYKRFGHALVLLNCKQQRHIDIDSLGDELLDGRNALLGTGHLDHHIRPVHQLPEPAGLVNRSLGVAPYIGGHFEAHVTVAALGLVVDRTQNVRGVLDVGNGEALEDRGGILHAFLFELL